MYRATSTRQARSLDNVTENPDHWRFGNRNANNPNPHLKFINEGSSNLTSDVGASSNELIER
jgi:hypothetical protein